jgi:hypothetical protein
MFLMLFLRLPIAGATARGLADGTYNIFIDLPGTADDGTATITIGLASVTAFHFADPLAQWDCIPCTFATSTPDFAEFNDTQHFFIDDNGQSPSVGLRFFAAGALGYYSPTGPTILSGSWSVVPEPSSSLLLGFGAFT